MAQFIDVLLRGVMLVLGLLLLFCREG